ncbi:hypothetical protein P7C70_g3270, partial [Phenoliferia sp. Uapishka_3]
MSNVKLHLHIPTGSQCRSGETLRGTVYFPPAVSSSNQSTKVNLVGFLESIARVAHKSKREILKEKLHAHGRKEGSTEVEKARESEEEEQQHQHDNKHKITSTLRTEFGRADVDLDGGSESVEFEIVLPKESVAFEGHPAIAPPPTCKFAVIWGVEAYVEGQVVDMHRFPFLPLPVDNLRDANRRSTNVGKGTIVPEQAGEAFTVSRTLKLSSNLQTPWGELTSTISLKRPLEVTRDRGIVHFNLTLSHEAPTGFGRSKDVKIYSCIVDLIQRTITKPIAGSDNSASEKEMKAAGDDGEDEDDKEELKDNEVSVRSQTFPLTVDIDPKGPERDFPLMFDLQAPAGNHTPTLHLTPTFETPNVRREYFLRFVINPAHNHRREVARVPIDVLPEASGCVVDHAMQDGVPIIP